MKTAPLSSARAKTTHASESARAGRKAAPSRGVSHPAIDPGQRQRMIADAAYFRAERRGFAGGSELQDWIEAEAEIDRMLSNRG